MCACIVASVCLDTTTVAFLAACSWRRHWGHQLRLLVEDAEAAASLKHPFGSQESNLSWKLWVVFR